MRAIAIDTNAYVGFKRGQQACLEVFQRADLLLISTTVLGELLAGFACGNRERENRDLIPTSRTWTGRLWVNPGMSFLPDR